MSDNPITPPPELAANWFAEIYDEPVIPLHPFTLRLVERAAQWGADQELEACCKWLVKQGWFSADEHEAIEELRIARRPKPPSLKVQALDQLAFMEDRYEGLNTDYIRRALEQLPDPISETH